MERASRRRVALACAAAAATGAAAYAAYVYYAELAADHKRQRAKPAGGAGGGAAFSAAAARVGAEGRRLGADAKLALYALYKQATCGDAPADARPAAWDVVGRAKHDAWARVAGLDAAAAEQAYVDAALAALESDRDGDGDGDAAVLRGGMGFGVSTMGGGEAEPEGADMTPALLAAKAGDVRALADALGAGGTLDGADEDGRTALHWAADGGHLEAVEFLCTRGATVDAADADGQTALHYAVTCEHEAVAQTLLRYGADPRAADADGARPADDRPRAWAAWWPV